MNRSPEYIETLLREKEFSQLTEAERELVLTHLSGESEYRNMRRLVSRVRETFQTEAAQLSEDADMKERVMLRFSQNMPKSEANQGIIDACISLLKRKPAFAFAGTLTLMVVVVTASVLFWPDPKPELAEKTDLPDLKEIYESPLQPADHTANVDLNANTKATTKEKNEERSDSRIVPVSPKVAEYPYASDDFDALKQDLPNEENTAAMEREDITISKAEADIEEKQHAPATATMKKESKNNTGKLREEKIMLNQASGTGKVFTAASELQDASPGHGTTAPSANKENTSKEAVQKQIVSYLWQKAQEEGKTDFLNAYRGRTVLLTITFQTDGKVKECMISGAADTLSGKWIKSKMAEMPGLYPPKGRQEAKYQITF